MATPFLPSTARLSTSGILLAVSCYVPWGIVPADWNTMDSVPAHEMLIARILWTLVWMIAVLNLGGGRRQIAIAGVVGMFQSIAPTLTFLLATFHYDEPFTRDAAIGIALVCAGLGLFLFDATPRLRGITPQ